MSIVAEILSSAGKLEKDELGTKIATLSRRIVDLKLQVQDELRVQYDEFLPVCVRTAELATKFDSYSNELASLNNLVENELVPQMRKSSEAFQDIRFQLAAATEALDVVDRLVAIQETLESSQTNLDVEHFVEAVESIEKLDVLITDLLRMCKDDGEQSIKALTGLDTECLVRREKLTHDLNEIWKASVVWEEEEVVEKKNANHPSVTLRVLRTSWNRDELVRAMLRLNCVEPKLSTFAQRLLKRVVAAVLTKACEVMTSSAADADEHGKIVLKLRIISATRPSPADVFAKLDVILEFLKEVFGSLPADADTKDDLPISRLFGGFFRSDFYDLLIKECLGPAVPTQRKDLSAYARVVEAVTKLQAQLVDIGVVTDEHDGIMAYAQNVDALFANKMCQDILVRARELMMKALHETIRPPDSQPEPKPDDTQKQNELSRNILKFPACQISKPAYDFVQLLYSVMEEASASGPLCAGRLFVTARNAIELYCNIVPAYHKDRLESLPQQAALFHNNCMYIAHHLLTLKEHFRGSSSSEKGFELLDKTITFVDQIPILRNLGAEVFLDQMRRQRRQVLSTLDAFHDAIGGGDADGALTIESAVKRCVLQLQHLKAVWKDVLPRKVFNRSMGTIVNSLTEDVIQRVVVMEDLSADGAIQLVAIFSVLKDQGPLLFQLSEDEQQEIMVQRYVAKWSKFVELLLVLAASLADIVDRWSAGKGPLAQEFTVDEVKRLIRAMFQNTDRRAAALSKIK